MTASDKRESSARVLLTPKWLVGHLLALGLVAIFVTLGLWQLDRLEQRLAANELIAERMGAQPQQLDILLEHYRDDLELLDYRPAVASGRFLPEDELLLRSRSHQGVAGWHLLTPLLREDGSALLVDRGWVPYELDEPPVMEATPPTGTVEVRGLLRVEQDPPEGGLSAIAPRDPPEGRLENAYYVDVDRLSGQFSYPLEPVYLVLTAQSPATPTELPLPPEPPDLEQGSHLSYALQWFSFALIGVIGYAILLWRTATSRRP